MSIKRKSETETFHSSGGLKKPKFDIFSSGQKITFVTGNANKLREVGQILGPKFASLLTNKAIDLCEIQGTMDKITTAKCKEAATIVKGPVLVEDTCLFFNALHGLPGPYVKDFMKIGVNDLPKVVANFDDKSADAICSFGFYSGIQGDEVKLLKGVIHGRVVDAPRGDNGFGWDPIFAPNGSEKTFAEMTQEEKNNFSHRSNAIMELKKFFEWETSACDNGQPTH